MPRVGVWTSESPKQQPGVETKTCQWGDSACLLIGPRGSDQWMSPAYWVYYEKLKTWMLDFSQFGILRISRRSGRLFLNCTFENKLNTLKVQRLSTILSSSSISSSSSGWQADTTRTKAPAPYHKHVGKKVKLVFGGSWTKLLAILGSSLIIECFKNTNCRYASTLMYIYIYIYIYNVCLFHKRYFDNTQKEKNRYKLRMSNYWLQSGIKHKPAITWWKGGCLIKETMINPICRARIQKYVHMTKIMTGSVNLMFSGGKKKKRKRNLRLNPVMQ